MSFDFLRCPCSGTGPGCGGVPLAGGVSTTGRLSTLSTRNALAALGGTYPGAQAATALAAGVGTAPLIPNYAPAVQIQQFEPAFFIPGECGRAKAVFATVPYSPTYVAAVAPVVVNPAAAATAATALADAVPFPTPTPVGPDPRGPPGTVPVPAPVPAGPRVATPCGCCSSVFSPLPPNGFRAWQQLIQETNRPYEQLLRCGYTTGCPLLRPW
jgi:hypothetical protein